MRLTEHQSRHRYDVERIMRVLAQAGRFRGFFDCYEFWSQYSDSYAAGWMGLPDSDEELRQILLNGDWSLT